MLVMTSARSGAGSGLIQTLPWSRPNRLEHNHRPNFLRAGFLPRGRSKVRRRHLPSQERFQAFSGWRPPAKTACPRSVRRGTHCSLSAPDSISPRFWSLLRWQNGRSICGRVVQGSGVRSRRESSTGGTALDFAGWRRESVMPLRKSKAVPPPLRGCGTALQTSTVRTGGLCFGGGVIGVG